MFDDEVHELPALQEIRHGLQDELHALDGDLADQRYGASSTDATVKATVDGNCSLLGLDIAEPALRRPHPQDVGRAIVEAVARARAQAGQASRESIAAVLDPAQPSVTGPHSSGGAASAPPVGTPAGRRRRHTPPPEEFDDEPFDIFGAQRDERRTW